MARLIPLHQVTSSHPGEEDTTEIQINVLNILLVEDTHEKERGAAKVVLNNGKAVYVEEDQDTIRDLANEEA